MSDKKELLNYFLAEVQKHFEFLLDHHFVISKQQRSIFGTRYAKLLYGNDLIEIMIDYDGYTYEIHLDLRTKTTPQKTILLSDLIRFYCVEDDIGFIAPQSSSKESISRVLSKISSLIKAHTELLDENQRMFAEINKYSRMAQKKSNRRLP